MLKDKLVSTLGQLLIGNVELQQQVDDLQAKLDEAMAKVPKEKPKGQAKK